MNPERSTLSATETCFALKDNPLWPIYNGYAVWSTCPQKWEENETRKKCENEDQSELLISLPVFDEDNLKTYKNIFCARCNGAVNTTYWRLSFVCSSWFNFTASNISTNVNTLLNNCSLDISPQDFQQSSLKRCIPRFQDCQVVSQQKNQSHCQMECLRYAFPVCFNSAGILRFRNPQCALCNGFKPFDLQNECESGSAPNLPPLTILFDFTSTSKCKIRVDEIKEGVFQRIERTVVCSGDELYDPYAASCKKVVSLEDYGDRQLDKRNSSDYWNPNCTIVTFNKTDFKQLPNGSIYSSHYRKTYNNNTYKFIDDKLLLCVNLSRNFTGTDLKRDYQWTEITRATPASLQLFTFIGSILSMVSLILLLLTYIMFTELRNLTGKIIINLAISLLLHQSCFFAGGEIKDPETCMSVAVLLHFFVLSSFTWMSVMAYDVHRIFAPLSKFIFLKESLKLFSEKGYEPSICLSLALRRCVENERCLDNMLHCCITPSSQERVMQL